MVKNKIFTILASVICLACMTTSSHALSPNQTQCSDTTASLSGDTTELSGNYFVYARSPKAVPSKLYAQPPDGSCATINTNFTPTTTWQLVGQLSSAQKSNVVLYFYNEIDEADITFDRPAVLLVPTDMPVALHGDIVSTTIGSNEATVEPVGSDLIANGIDIKKVTNPTRDTISRVNYYIDNEFRYSKSRLDAFDNYQSIDPYAKLLSRVIIYNSGQTLTLEETAAFHPTTFWQFIVYVYSRVSNIIQWSLVISLIFAVLLLIRYIVRRVHARRMMLISHGLRPVGGKYSVVFGWLRATSFYVKTAQVTEVTYGAIRVIVPVFVIGLLIISSAFDVNIVNGHSMEYTIPDGKHVVVNKMPQTIRKLVTGSDYVPRRGDVVIVKTILSTSSSPLLNARPEGTIIKRVIGIPGDTVAVHNDDITITTAGQSIIKIDDNPIWNASRQHETRPISITTTLKPDEIFVAGDNRAESIDSRIIGPFKLNQIVGEVIAVF